MGKGIFIKLMVVTAAMSLVLSGCGGSSSDSSSSSGEDLSGEISKEDLITVRVGVMSGNTSQWFAEVGLETGIYEQHGLNVEVTEYAAGIYTVDALVTEQIDIGNVADFAGINRIGSTSEVTDLRFVSQLAHSATSNLYVNPDKISKLSDLEGKNILTLLGTVWEYWNGKTIEAAGLTEEDVNYVAVDSSQDGIAVATAGDADVFWASGTTADKLEELGWKPLIGQEDLGTQTYQYYMTTDAYLSENQETLALFFDATEDIISYIDLNEDKAADIIYDRTGMDQETFKTTNGDMVNEIAFTQEAYDELADVNSWAYSNGFYENEYKVEDYIDTTALSAYDTDKVSWEAK